MEKPFPTTKVVSKLFSGEYQHSIDAKGRVIMPAKFREELGERFTVTRGLDNSLFVFPVNEWQNFYNKLSTLPMTNSNARAFTRRFLAGAVECEADKQGRILLPQPLRTYAKIEKDVTFTGNGNKVEIWSSDVWNDYMDNLDADEITQGLEDLGI